VKRMFVREEVEVGKKWYVWFGPWKETSGLAMTSREAVNGTRQESWKFWVSRELV